MLADGDLVIVAAIGAISAVLAALITGLCLIGVEKMRRENTLQHSAASKERTATAQVVVAALDERLEPVKQQIADAADHAATGRKLLEAHIELEQQRWELHHQRLSRLEVQWGDQH